MKIEIDLIDVPERLRSTDPVWVEALAENMAEYGQKQAIKLRPQQGGRFLLVYGEHRLKAAKLLRWREIGAEVSKLSDLEARLEEIDENLYRHELSPLDRATFLGERRRIYLELHPEAAPHVAGGLARQGLATDTVSFADATSEKLGLDARTIARAVSIYTKLAPDVRTRLRGTALSKNQSELLALAKCGPEVQRQVLDLLLAEEPEVKKVGQAVRAVQGHHAGQDATGEGAGPKDDGGHGRLMDAWRKASPAARAEFVAWLGERGHLPANDTATDSGEEAA